MVYLGSKAEFSINMDKIASGGQVNAFWIDPRDGEQEPVGTLEHGRLRSRHRRDGRTPCWSWSRQGHEMAVASG